jgi:hypothetical protein
MIYALTIIVNLKREDDMRLEWLGGAAEIALLATMGSASAVPCTTGSCTVTGSIFTGTTPPAGFDNFGTGTANSRQSDTTPFFFPPSQTITWSGGTPNISGVFAGSVPNAFTTPFNGNPTQRYLAAEGGGGTVTVTDTVGQGDTLSLIWGTVDNDDTRNIFMSGGNSVSGATALAACGGIANTSNCIINISGLGNWTTFTASDSGAAAFEFVPPAQIPEPASMAILGAALAGFGVLRRRRKTT